MNDKNFYGSLSGVAKIENSNKEINSLIKPKPFVKWVGGKRGVMKELILRLPNEINNYYESFVGGGALFLKYIIKLQKLSYRI